MRRGAGIVVAAVAAVAGLGAGVAQAETRVVGPGHPYAKPCAAMAAAQPGDTIQIDAAGNGTYDGDVCASSVRNLTIEGINGRAHIDAAGKSSGGKAIWVLSGVGMVVRNLELSGAAVPDRNGAAIRLEGGSLTLDQVFFHHNEDGILTSNDRSIDLTILRSEFADNGAGDGQSHNIYVGAINHFTMRASWSHRVRVGHLVKSRAATNDIVANRLTEDGGSGSYELDLPNGGESYVTGNLIEQGPETQNAAMLAYGEEGATDPGAPLVVTSNTFVNDRPGSATAIMVGGSVTRPVVVANTINAGASTFVTQASALLFSNCVAADPQFVDRAAYDYHLRETSPCRDVGSGGVPTFQYLYNLETEQRREYGPPDAGAFEWVPPAGAGGGTGGGSGGIVPPPSGPAPGSPSGGGGATTPRLAILARRVRRDGAIRLTVRAPAAGRLTARATARRGRARLTYATGAATFRRAGTRTLTLRPTRAGRRSLQRHRRLATTITITFRTATGAKVTRRIALTVRRR